VKPVGLPEVPIPPGTPPRRLRLILLAVWLGFPLGCAKVPRRPYPHGPRCAADGVHKHLPDSTKIKEKP